MYSINHNILPREEGANKFFINSCNTYKFEVIFIELKNKIFYGYIFKRWCNMLNKHELYFKQLYCSKQIVESKIDKKSWDTLNLDQVHELSLIAHNLHGILSLTHDYGLRPKVLTHDLQYTFGWKVFNMTTRSSACIYTHIHASNTAIGKPGQGMTAVKETRIRGPFFYLGIVRLTFSFFFFTYHF